MLGPAIATWFTADFSHRDPETAEALLRSLCGTDQEGYAATCEALAQFDVRHRLGSIANDATAIAGGQDVATPPLSLRYIAEHIPGCRYLELAGTAHLAPAEHPDLIVDERLTNTRSPI
jgi:3-oxoadipate enol-lactonase / 4-carboxymuconolactone decarboxylase